MGVQVFIRGRDGRETFVGEVQPAKFAHRRHPQPIGDNHTIHHGSYVSGGGARKHPQFVGGCRVH